MGITIDDGRGKGISVGVSSIGNRMDVSSRSNTRIFYNSRDIGESYTWSCRYLINAGSTIIFIKNTSTTKNLIIEDIDVGAATVAEWELWTSTANGAGVVISVTNLLPAKGLKKFSATSSTLKF